ncbi:MAG: hypothetical protein ABI438_05715 [Dermatophilaceae bacterium]
MSSTVIWALALFVVVVAIVVGTVVSVMQSRAKARREAGKRTVATPCVANGHSYRIYETGWRCDICGNYVSRVDGEVYGPEVDGLRERRREPR